MLLLSLTFGLTIASALVSASSIRAPPRQQAYCYQQRPADQPQRSKALALDCFTLARKLVRRLPRPKQQIEWSRDPAKGIKLPRTFSEKTCVFEIDMLNGGGRAASASFADIAFGSNDIVAPCVHEEPHLGGLIKIGPNAALHLFVYGQPYEPPEDVEDLAATA
ncbi:MAG: hypothetical protein Q9213_007341 [Squamulea squamosa]